MTNMNEFVDWAQDQMDRCNVHNEIEASKLIVEIMKKFFAVGKETPEIPKAN